MGWKMLASKSWHFPSLFKPGNGNGVPVVYSFPLHKCLELSYDVAGDCPAGAVCQAAV